MVDMTNYSSARHVPEIPKERKGLRLLLAVKRGMLGYFVRLMQSEGAFAWLSMGGRNVLMLNDAAGIEHVFKNNAQNYKKSYFYKVLKPLLGNSMLLTEGNVWKKQRQETVPAFNNRNLNEMSQQMVEAMEAMFQRWAPSIERAEPINLNFESMWFTLDVLLRTLFHEARGDIAFNMQTAITTMLREAEERVWAPISLPQWLTFKFPKYRKALKFLNDTLGDLVEARRQNRAYPEDLLSRLIENYGTTPEQQRNLRDQVMTFLLAGHETTANGLVWACYYLSKHPEVWQKMEREADEVLAGRTPTMQDLKNLTYIRQTFDEVLRFHPIVWTMSRDALHDDQIPLDDGSYIFAPKGTVVMLCTYAVHHRDSYWENPEVFDPDRFEPEASRHRPSFAYFPFGGGPRQCLGLRFAQIESIIALAMLAQRFRIELVSGQNIHPVPNITLRPNGPMLFRIKERSNVRQRTDETLPEQPSNKCPFEHAA